MDAEPGWLAVSLTVDGERAEAVAEVLARYVPGGVVIESTAVAQGERDAHAQAVGPLRVTGYLPVDDQVEDTRARLEEALWYLGRIQPIPSPEFHPVLETDWTRAWRKHYRPIAIGRRFLIVPAWLEAEPGNRIPLYIEPGMAFGTGTHPSTQLCLEMLEGWVAPGRPALDVGCGSGILAIAALKLGASRALGLDTDPSAVRAARENARLNGVSDRMAVRAGSLETARNGEHPFRAPLVLANILAPVIVRLLGEGLADLVTGDGALVLSGILEEQERAVQNRIEEVGLQLRQRARQEDWIALVVAKTGS